MKKVTLTIVCEDNDANCLAREMEKNALAQEGLYILACGDIQELTEEETKEVSEQLPDYLSFRPEEIAEFLLKFGKEISGNETIDQIELMMDDHICVQYRRKLYYIKEDNSLYTQSEEALHDFLYQYYKFKER